MGRLLEIARELPQVEAPAGSSLISQRMARIESGRAIKITLPSASGYELNELRSKVVTIAPDWNQPDADVLDILARAARPVPHPQIVRDMATRGYSKAAAYQAIADCQGKGWIWHNLTTGYELPGKD